MRCEFCDGEATMMAEASDMPDVPLCDWHYEHLIGEAEKHNPEYPAGEVRLCMERASYPVRRTSH